jgi:hypothetical protein
MRYDGKGAIFFKDAEGNEYKTDRKGAWELAALVLEALDMDISERDELLFRLEDQMENKIA